MHGMFADNRISIAIRGAQGVRRVPVVVAVREA